LPPNEKFTSRNLRHFEEGELEVHLHLLVMLEAFLDKKTYDLRDYDYGWTSSRFMADHGFCFWMWSPVDKEEGDPSERRKHHTCFEVELRGQREGDELYFLIPLNVPKEEAWEICRHAIAQIQLMVAQ